MLKHFIGVPVLQIGPPKVHVEYSPSPPAHSHQQIQTGHHHHHQVINHNENNLSFFEQIKQTLGFGSTGYQSAPPPQAPINHYIPPKVHTKYGVPPKPHFISKPPAVYGMHLQMNCTLFVAQGTSSFQCAADVH